jgi:hypothetical protein
MLLIRDVHEYRATEKKINGKNKIKSQIAGPAFQQLK